MNFITNSTKIRCIVASAITGLALITLIMLSSLLTISPAAKTLMTFIYTGSLMLVLLLWQGILQINVFNDYKSKRNYLCADGIVSICMSALLIISAILLGALQADKVIAGTWIGSSDIRIFLTTFLFVLSMWKLTVMIISIKERHFNWWCEMLFSALWLGLTILCLLSMFITGSAIVWVIVAFGWSIIALTIFYMIFSYVIKKPTYLETDEALEERQEEIEEKRLEKEKAQAKNITTTTSFRLQEKLKKLKDLYDNNLITEEEYNQKKSQLLETF